MLRQATGESISNKDNEDEKGRKQTGLWMPSGGNKPQESAFARDLGADLMPELAPETYLKKIARETNHSWSVSELA